MGRCDVGGGERGFAEVYDEGDAAWNQEAVSGSTGVGGPGYYV